MCRSWLREAQVDADGHRPPCTLSSLPLGSDTLRTPSTGAGGSRKEQEMDRHPSTTQVLSPEPLDVILEGERVFDRCDEVD